MIIYDMEVQCLKMWDRVTGEKLQIASSFVNHLQFGNLSLVIYCSFIPVKVYTCLTPSLRLLSCLLNDTVLAMITFYMEVQCFERWDEVKLKSWQVARVSADQLRTNYITP